MIGRGFDFVYYFCRCPNFPQKCGVLSRVISSSGTCQNKEVKNSRVHSLNRELLEVDKKKFEDTFGNIESFEMMFQRIKDDPEDIREYQRERQAQGKSIAQYIKEIKSHLDDFDYKSAIKVLEVDMVNDKKQPVVFVYKVLISYNARIGNLEEAYRLFVNYKKRQGRVTGAMYTSMFNACANCKNSFLALQKADAVRECMRNNKSHVINASNYNAMLKAYGRHSDLATCLKIMDEVLYKRDKVHSITYAFLLQACISDKNSGLRYALIVWRKMIQNRVKPSIYSFNLLLRCIRECSLGDALLIPNLVEEILKESGKFFRQKVQIKTVNNQKMRTILKIPSDGRDLMATMENEFSQSHIGTGGQNIIDFNNVETQEFVSTSDDAVSENVVPLGKSFSPNEVQNLNNQGNQLELKENDSIPYKSVVVVSGADSPKGEQEHCKNKLSTEIQASDSQLPNLLALHPSTGSAIKFGVMTEPYFRFMLVGGIRGFLKTMTEFGIKPNIKTFTLILDVIPSTLEAEQELLSIVETHKIPLDTAFFNVLMKRRIFRQEDFLVKDCLQQMHSLNLSPDLITFGILALGCRTYESGLNLLRNIRNYGYRVNEEILTALLDNAKRARDLNYASAVLKEAKDSDTQLSQKFLADVADLVKRERYLRKKEEESKLNKAEEPVTREPLCSQ